MNEGIQDTIIKKEGIDMIKELVKKNNYLFMDEIADWKDAIKLSCYCLEKQGSIDSSYATSIIESIHTYGPYIICMPNVALPHFTQDNTGVYKTSVSFMKVNKPVSFEQHKTAQLFFTVASCNALAHMHMMQQLFAIFSHPKAMHDLLQATTANDLLQIDTKYFTRGK